MRDAGRPAGADKADLGMGVGVVALAALVLQQTAAIPASPLYARVGPTLVPWIVGTVLLVLGVLLVLSAIRGGWSAGLEEVRDAPPPNWKSFAIMWVALVANAALIVPLGFIIAATVQFVLAAAAFGSRRHLRDLGIGAAITVGAYLLFDRALGVNIGAGILEGIV